MEGLQQENYQKGFEERASRWIQSDPTSRFHLPVILFPFHKQEHCGQEEAKSDKFVDAPKNNVELKTLAAADAGAGLACLK